MRLYQMNGKTAVPSHRSSGGKICLHTRSAKNALTGKGVPLILSPHLGSNLLMGNGAAIKSLQHKLKSIQVNSVEPRKKRYISL